MVKASLHCGDCREVLSRMKAKSKHLVIGSPPYHGKMRRYGDNKKMSDREWALWMAHVVEKAVRISMGPVVMVVNGCVQDGCYKPSCERLVVNCDDMGIRCERPVIWHKNSTPNRKDYFGNAWEYVLAFGDSGSTWNWEEIAEPPKYEAGGHFRQRNAKGERTRGSDYPTNELARPRDVLYRTVGGGHMGSPLAHENEAPFPESLVETFIRSLTNPGDVVLDPFCGSGTTLAVALRLGRKAIGIDNRSSQIDLTDRRLAESA
ncbi:MAG: site-specific DNA-methyltransferase [Pseudomonadota bacterium]